MNYADNNPAYTDLDPSSMAVDGVYSSLSDATGFLACVASCNAFCMLVDN